MSFEEGIRTEGLRAKRKYPGLDNVIDRVTEDFTVKQAKGEFRGWDWNMIAEDFHSAIDRKCVRSRPFKSNKRMSK